MPEFTCQHTYSNGERKSWTGTWEVLIDGTDFMVIRIAGRSSSFDAILGCSLASGHYLCIPSIDAGCALERWSNVLWNTNRISQVLNETDAVTIATALNHYERFHNPVYD